MRAVIFDGNLKYSESYPKPELREGSVIVKVLRAGICNTDLEITKGYMGFKGVLGHEFIGIVSESEDPSLKGRRVTGEINFLCGKCEWCRKGLGRHCPDRTTLGICKADGCMADFCSIPLNCLVEIPPEIPDAKAIFIEPLSAACNILEQLEYSGGEKVVVLGCGKLGILCAWVLSTAFRDVTLVGRTPAKLEISKWNNLRTTTDIAEMSGADIIVEATGTVAGFKAAMQYCRPRGTIVLKSTTAENEPVNLSKIVIDEIKVVGSRCGLFSDGFKILKGYPDIPLERLVSAVYPAEKSLEAFGKSKGKGMLKVMIDFSGR